MTYEAVGWTGYIPDAIKNTELHLPMKYAKLLWGWPNMFIERMESVNTRVVIVNGDGEWSEGFDRIEDLDKLPEGYSGYVGLIGLTRLREIRISGTKCMYHTILAEISMKILSHEPLYTNTI